MFLIKANCFSSFRPKKKYINGQGWSHRRRSTFWSTENTKIKSTNRMLTNDEEKAS